MGARQSCTKEQEQDLRVFLSDRVGTEFAAALSEAQLRRLVRASLDNAENLSSLGAVEYLTRPPVSLPLGTAARLYKVFEDRKKRGREDEASETTEQAKRTVDSRATTSRFRQAMKAPEKAPTNLRELETMLALRCGDLIPVSQAFYDEIGQEPEVEFVFPGCGPVADYMSTALRALSTVTVGEGETEQVTAISTSSWLFTHLYDMLQKNLDEALALQVLLNASTASAAKSTLSCPIQGLKRPDVVAMSERKVSLLIVEEKKAGDMEAAVADVGNYLAGGLPVAYQKIQGIPVAAVAGCDIKLGLCDVHGTVALMTNVIRVGSLNGAIRAMFAALNIYRLMRLLNNQAPKALMDMGLGGVLQRPNDCSIYFGSRSNGIIKIIDNFGTYAQNFGADFKGIQAAYQVKSPFLPEINEEPSLTGKTRKQYWLQMMTFGMKLVKLAELKEEEVARCVYAWLSVARELHAKGICAADFRWPNMMEQQKRALPESAAHNPAYEALESIPLIIDMELARAPDLVPPEMLQSWVEGEEGTLQRRQGGSADERVYTRSSDVYQIGVMLEQWRAAQPGCSPGVAACVAELKSHKRSATYIAQNDPWLESARTAFAGLV